jgi:PHD/YefM family antitoxin component YafN of YafNO toxin-antitoxin module
MAEALRSVALRPEQHEAFEAHSLETELPPAGTRHWVPRYKAAVVAAVETGVLGLEDAGRRYLLSEEEYESWRDTIDRYGVLGLRMSVQEQRSAPRVAVSERGAARLNAGESTDCLITDVSDRGARIKVDAQVKLPDLFELSCEANGRSWWVDLVWQPGDEAGVRFTNPLPPPLAIKSGLGDWLVGRGDTVRID